MKPDDSIISRILFHPREEEPGYVPLGIRTVSVSGGARIGSGAHYSDFLKNDGRK